MRYVIWDRQVLRPAAQETYGADVARVDNYGSYSCRRIYGSERISDRPSEHARANALDVAGVTLEDGRRVSLAADWDGDGRPDVRARCSCAASAGAPARCSPPCWGRTTTPPTRTTCISTAPRAASAAEIRESFPG